MNETSQVFIIGVFAIPLLLESDQFIFSSSKKATSKSTPPVAKLWVGPKSTFVHVLVHVCVCVCVGVGVGMSVCV